MATKKKEDAEVALRAETAAAYEAALGEYSGAVEAMRRGDYGQAKELFEKVRAETRNEPELGDRASIYARICGRKLAPAAGEPEGPEDLYRKSVFRMNSGDVDGALQLLNRALAENPLSVNFLYVRACAWALQGAAEKAVGDLRQAMAVEPQIRFQAINDPDFERIREEPAFIDIIEPTPAGD